MIKKTVLSETRGRGRNAKLRLRSGSTFFVNGVFIETPNSFYWSYEQDVFSNRVEVIEFYNKKTGVLIAKFMSDSVIDAVRVEQR